MGSRRLGQSEAKGRGVKESGQMTQAQVTVYFNSDDEVTLYERIVELAKANKRSVSAQIVYMLTERTQPGA